MSASTISGDRTEPATINGRAPSGQGTRRPHEPAIVQPGRNTRARSRVRVQWLALAAALVVLAGTLVAWALSRAAERVPVVSVARPVQVGDIITIDDLTTSDVAVDAGVRGLVPAESLGNIAGRVAAIELTTGMLLSSGMWADDTELQPHERTIGAVLRAGRFPAGLAHGSSAWAIDVHTPAGGAADATSGTPATAPIVVRILDVTIDEAGAMVVTLAVPADSAVATAALAATDTLSLAGMPEVTP